MIVTLEAIYENGVLRPLSSLNLPEHTRVRVAVEDLGDEERTEWLAQSERQLTKIWDNPGDDIFNDLLTP